ncbi:ribonuclease P protein component [Romboutsia sp. 1001713B170131_170501_G6]|uniref:ribonuclease P protein component n=1 Tax=Romboutsia sp. 1001713B170131_170501_G6 TaxID=2787108 RepID=UPI0018ABD358|nr:ribonuclease P protein component [Romboutsia sp. 1001713B170131_170501_G6]
MDFKKTKGLKKDSDFRKVYKHGKSFATKYLVMYVLDNKSDDTKLGISVSKKVGKAIVRNKIRRRIRESYRLNVDENVKSGYDIVFIARIASNQAEYKDIEKSVKYLVKKANLRLSE